MMNILRIPAREQYAYVEVHYEGMPEEALEEYKRLTRFMTGGEGLARKEFTTILDSILSTGRSPLTPEQWEAMSDEQKLMLTEIRKSWTRTGFDLLFILDRQKQREQEDAAVNHQDVSV